MNNFRIRQATSDDYHALADLINATNPNLPTSAERLAQEDAARPPYCLWARWVAEQGQRYIGLGLYMQHPLQYIPASANLMVRVHPDFEGCGIGRALYAVAEQGAIAEGIRTFYGGISESVPRAMDFAQRSGFQETGRQIESRLLLADYDPAAHTEVLPALATRGIEIHALDALDDKSAWEARIYDLFVTTIGDIPASVTLTMPPFEEFRTQEFENPKVPHAGILMALAGGELVGVTTHRDLSDTRLNVDYTAVRRDYRGRGVAYGLKVAGAQYAKARGVELLMTTNDATNPAILTLNRRMGFEPLPAWILVQKEVESDVSV